MLESSDNPKFIAEQTKRENKMERRNTAQDLRNTYQVNLIQKTVLKTQYDRLL